MPLVAMFNRWCKRRAVRPQGEEREFGWSVLSQAWRPASPTARLPVRSVSWKQCLGPDCCHLERQNYCRQVIGEEVEGGDLGLLLGRGLEMVAIDDEQVADRLESIAKHPQVVGLGGLGEAEGPENFDCVDACGVARHGGHTGRRTHVKPGRPTCRGNVKTQAWAPASRVPRP